MKGRLALVTGSTAGIGYAIAETLAQEDARVIISGRTQAAVEADDKPAAAFDYCYLTSDTSFSTKVADFSVCDADPVLAIFASPQQVAGGPLAENVMKCRLQPLNINDYPPGTFSGAQWARLEATFPDGVCNWNKRGVEQQPAVTYLTYEDGPGGKRLPREPHSH